ncbi:MAG: glycosyltransferase family 2 protein [Candidatus Bathyarchaeia archaeon]|uniref:glycosyltransferase family 2 protein n=1 Tax=Thermofilum sp. TaxID=1961369 RepID=UPI003169F826
MRVFKVAVAILYHGSRWEALRKVLESLSKLEYDKENTMLILVNNKACEETVEIVRKWLVENENNFERTIHVELDGNVPKLRNFCLRKAIELSYSHVFFVDSDVILSRDSLRRLLKIFEHDEENKIFAASLPYYIPLERDTVFTKIRAKYGVGSLATLQKSSGPYPVPSIGMGATLINLSLIPKVGYFDEEIPYIEDINLTRRATNMGYQVILDPGVQLIHDKTMRTLNWLKFTFKLGEIEVKNMIRVGTWKSEVRGLTYWILLLLSFFLIVLSPIPFIVLFAIGYLSYFRKFRGIGKIIGFPIVSVHKTIRSAGIVVGLFIYMIHKIKRK